jgi:hypothetical protein
MLIRSADGKLFELTPPGVPAAILWSYARRICPHFTGFSRDLTPP